MKKCHMCGKPATLHFTQIINNEMKNIDLCDECAAKNGILEGQGTPLAMLAALGEALFSDVKQNISALSGIICSSCGCTPITFKETGRLGCANCYKDLKLIVDKLIESSQKGECHVGKKIINQHSENITEENKTATIHVKKIKKTSSKSKLHELQIELSRAISDERYEDAAKIRDEIQKLKK